MTTSFYCAACAFWFKPSSHWLYVVCLEPIIGIWCFTSPTNSTPILYRATRLLFSALIWKYIDGIFPDPNVTRDIYLKAQYTWHWLDQTYTRIILHLRCWFVIISFCMLVFINVYHIATIRIQPNIIKNTCTMIQELDHPLIKGKYVTKFWGGCKASPGFTDSPGQPTQPCCLSWNWYEVL